MSKADKRIDRLRRRVRAGTATSDERRKYIQAGPHVRKLTARQIDALVAKRKPRWEG